MLDNAADKISKWAGRVSNASFVSLMGAGGMGGALALKLALTNSMGTAADPKALMAITGTGILALAGSIGLNGVRRGMRYAENLVRQADSPSAAVGGLQDKLRSVGAQAFAYGVASKPVREISHATMPEGGALASVGVMGAIGADAIGRLSGVAAALHMTKKTLGVQALHEENPGLETS